MTTEVTVLVISRMDRPNMDVREEAHTSGQALYAQSDFENIKRWAEELDLPIEAYLIDETRDEDGKVVYAVMKESYRNWSYSTF